MSVGEALTTDQRPAGIADVRGAAEALRAVMARFDPALVTVTDAMDLVGVFAEIARMGTAGEAFCVKRVDEAPRLVKAKGYKDAVDFAARSTGVTPGDAMGLLATAQAMDGLDVTAEVYKTGGLSPRKARAVAGAARANPDAEADMIKLARQGSLHDVEARSRQVRREASHETDEQRAAKAQRRRTLREWTDPHTGDGCGQWRLPPAAHAEVMAALKERGHVFFERARRAGRRENQGAYLADGLVALTTSRPSSVDTDANTDDEPTRRNRRHTKILVRADATGLARGETEPGERCEIAGTGPIPVGEAIALLADPGVETAVVFTDAQDHTVITGIAHLGRRPVDLDEWTAPRLAEIEATAVDIAAVVHPRRQPLATQETALEWISGGRCQTRGCSSGTGRLEIDHEPPWEHTQRTLLAELGYVCGHCHDLKTHQGWTFGPLAGDGRRGLHPPPDTS